MSPVLCLGDTIQRNIPNLLLYLYSNKQHRKGIDSDEGTVSNYNSLPMHTNVVLIKTDIVSGLYDAAASCGYAMYVRYDRGPVKILTEIFLEVC